MKIFALSSSPYPPHHSPMAHRLHCYMLALQEAGHEVMVLGMSNELGKGEYEGIPYVYIPVPQESRLFYSSTYLKHFADTLEPWLKECDVFFHSEDRNSLILSIQRLANKWRVATVLEINEYPYGFKTRRLDTWLLRWVKQRYFFRRVLPQVGGAIVISAALRNATQKKNRNILLLPVLTKTWEIDRVANSSAEKIILHAGTLSDTKDGIKAMLMAFNVASKQLNSPLKFVFTSKVGMPGLIAWINKFIANNGLEERVVFTGIVSGDELHELYNRCSLAIVNKPLNLQNIHNFPTKLTQLIPRRIPLIISKSGELARYFKDDVHAVMVEPNNVEEIAKGIIKILEDDKFVSNITTQALGLCQREFYYKRHAQSLSEFFSALKNRN